MHARTHAHTDTPPPPTHTHTHTHARTSVALRLQSPNGLLGTGSPGRLFFHGALRPRNRTAYKGQGKNRVGREKPRPSSPFTQILSYDSLSMALNIHRNHEAYEGRGDGGSWGGGGFRGYGGGGRERLYTYRYTVTIRMTPALRWAAMRAILMCH